MSLIIDLESVVWELEHSYEKESNELAEEYRSAITILVSKKPTTSCKFLHVIEDLIIAKGFDSSLEKEYSVAIEKLENASKVI